MVVGGVGLPAFDVVCDVFYEDRRDFGLLKFVDECVYVYCVEGFCHVQRCGDCACGWFLFVETGGDGVVYVVECGAG